MSAGLTISAVLLAYVLGSMPTAYLMARLARGIDIRRVGTGNVGALNTFKQAGAPAGIATLLLDALKGALAALLPTFLGLPEEALYLTAVAVVAGHNWPVFLGFHGGKGAATVMGISLVVLPWLTLLAFGITLLAGLAARNPVGGVTVGFVALNGFTAATGQGWAQVSLCLFLSLIVAATYLGGSWRQTVGAFRQRRWLDLFNFE